MLQMYLWRTIASAGPTASVVLVPATPDLVSSIVIVSPAGV
ncbi:hypothetical protein [Acinetobacter baumannii]|nr:hypothetical protein [Acinetobacter baumannii]